MRALPRRRSMYVAGLAALAAVAALLSSCGGGGAATTTGYVTGTVRAQPSCPVQRVSSPCPPAPVKGATVQLLRGGDVIAADHTDARGRFRLSASPRTYVIRATATGTHPTSDSRTVRVGSGATTEVTLTVDLGIR